MIGVQVVVLSITLYSSDKFFAEEILLLDDHTLNKVISMKKYWHGIYSFAIIVICNNLGHPKFYSRV